MVPIDRRLTVDGAWLGRVPIRELVELGSPRVIACVSDDAGRLLRGAFWTKSMTVPPVTTSSRTVPSPLPVLTVTTYGPEGNAPASGRTAS